MKKLVAVMCVVLMITGFVVIAGCGDSGGTDGEEVVVVDTDEPLEEGIVGTFESFEGLVITFKGDGTFETDAWGEDGEGTYEIVEGEIGNDVVLTFSDGAEETLSIAISMGEVAAVLDAEGNQFTKE